MTMARLAAEIATPDELRALLIEQAEEYERLQAQHDDLVSALGAEYKDGLWMLPFFGVTSAGEVVAELFLVDDWIERRIEAAKRLAQ